jgi:hypothetical protein
MQQKFASIGSVPGALREVYQKICDQLVAANPNYIVYYNVDALDHEEQILNTNEYTDATLKGKPIHGYIIHLCQVGIYCVYGIQGHSEDGIKIIGDILNNHNCILGEYS